MDKADRKRIESQIVEWAKENTPFYCDEDWEILWPDEDGKTSKEVVVE